MYVHFQVQILTITADVRQPHGDLHLHYQLREAYMQIAGIVLSRTQNSGACISLGVLGQQLLEFGDGVFGGSKSLSKLIQKVVQKRKEQGPPEVLLRACAG